MGLDKETLANVFLSEALADVHSIKLLTQSNYGHEPADENSVLIALRSNEGSGKHTKHMDGGTDSDKSLVP